MLLLATQALALDLALRIDQPDLPTHRVVLCGVSEEGTSSARIQVPGPGLLAWQFHAFARPGDSESQLLVSVPFAAVDLRAGPAGDSESEMHTITPAIVPAFSIAIGGSGTVTYPVLMEGAPHPSIVIPGQKEAVLPRFTLVATRLAPGTAGCAP